MSGILSRESKLILSTEPSLITMEELPVDIVEHGVSTRVVVVAEVEEVIEVTMWSMRPRPNCFAHLSRADEDKGFGSR